MDPMDNKFFQVSVKALCFDEDHKLMLLQQEDGLWEPAGGRVERGEELLDCLRRECLEETGLVCELLEQQPSIVYSAINKWGQGRVMLYYKVKFQHLNFKPSNECVDIKFFTKEEMQSLSMAPHIKKLLEFL